MRPLRSRLKLCTAIAAEDPVKMSRKAERALSLGSDLVEFRLDTLKVVKPEMVIRSLSKFADRCVVTLRPRKEGGNFKGSDSTRIGLLSKVCELEPAYADVELETAKKFRSELDQIRGNSRKVIISWHDFESTPSTSKLLSLYRKAKSLGDIAKEVTTARSIEDNALVLSLYKHSGRSDLIAFCMGDQGALSRIMCLFAGSPFAYTSLPDEAVAPGQLSIQTMKGILNAIS
jgi:3-dehydroquinate dehydratase-1